jgi:hypothetical protein
MKTRLIFLVLLIGCFACGTNNKQVSDAQKEKIKGEVKEVVKTIFKGCEEVNYDITGESCLESPDFIYTYNGNSLDYKQFSDVIKLDFSELINQKITIINEKYVLLNKSTVIYTTNCKWLQNYKDGHAILDDPMITQFTFKEINNKWKVINLVQSCVAQNVKNSEKSKGLNQVELAKQILGSWKCDIAKDTTVFWEQKPFGTGQDIYFKYVTKGKTVLEGKQLCGYDKKMDKIIFAHLIKGMDMELYAVWFISHKKFVIIPFSDISNPEKASIRWEGEFKSPDMYIETTIINNKPIKTETYIRL